MRQHHVLAHQPDQIEIGLQQRRSLPAQQARLHLAHEAGEQRAEQQHQQHLRALQGEIADHRPYREHQQEQHQRREHQREILADREELQVIELFGGVFDGSGDRRVSCVPDQIVQLHRQARGRRCARRRHLADLARAEHGWCRRRGGSAARSSRRCIASPGSGPDSRNPRPGRAAVCRRPADEWQRPRSSRTAARR